MQVACPNCGHAQETEIESGATASRAKCVECGTSFLVRVRRTKEAPDDEPLYAWFVKKGDGTLFSFPGDPQLHQGIKNGFVGADDSISADGTTWTTISSLPILAAFLEKWQQPQPDDQTPASSLAGPPRKPGSEFPTRTEGPGALQAVRDHVEVASQPTQAAVSVEEAQKAAAESARAMQADAASQAGVQLATTGTSPEVPGASARKRPSAETARHPTDRELEWGAEWNPKETYKDEATGMTLLMKRNRRRAVVGAVAVVLALGAAAFGMYHLNKTALTKDGSAKSADKKKDVVEAVDVRAQNDAVSNADGGAVDATLGDVKTEVSADMASAKVAEVVATSGSPVGHADVKSALPPDVVAVAPPRDISTQSDLVSASTGGATGDVAAPVEVKKQPGKEADAGPDDKGPGLAALTPEPKLALRDKKTESGGKSDAGRKGDRKSDRKSDRVRDAKKEDKKDSGDGDPGDFDGLMSKGNKLRKSKKYGKAVKYYLKATKIKPGHSEPQYKLAECYRHTGKCGVAVGHYERAIEISGFKSAYIGISNCYKSMGNKAQARAWLQKGLKRYDDAVMKMKLQQLSE